MFKVCVIVALVCVAANAAVFPVANNGCPPIRPGEVGICAFMCGTSSLQRRFFEGNSCPAGKICCPTACGGTSCVTPVTKRAVSNKLCLQGLVNCFVDPCMFASCPAHPEARCQSNYCGGCNADFYVGVTKVDC